MYFIIGLYVLMSLLASATIMDAEMDNPSMSPFDIAWRGVATFLLWPLLSVILALCVLIYLLRK